MSLPPRPVLTVSNTTKIVIAGQALGLRLYETDIAFNNRSGDRLRHWLGFSREVFYNKYFFSIVPMGFYFPGYDKTKGDLPPRKECKMTWNDKIFESMQKM
ncbi:uracil-DNA glycosylase family protein [Bartonella tamiae]|uniref:Uracil-DNA glycosylase-like domain-containing protein n=1 Tax=Bartonella tamiae Th239 TaxID=1094558 RepID=J0QZR7_9HYPH|nr:uracil-DNA glycosylase family protein [Bartonella tamiae]EJF88744.1 hypothetical protein ME5_01295 [Bartonella tamiae Th239]EJF95006.1 hypothetical protein MEG_00587 [Bartonella tamiae Th307]